MFNVSHVLFLFQEHRRYRHTVDNLQLLPHRNAATYKIYPATFTLLTRTRKRQALKLLTRARRRISILLLHIRKKCISRNVDVRLWTQFRTNKQQLILWCTSHVCICTYLTVKYRQSVFRLGFIKPLNSYLYTDTVLLNQC